MWKDVGERDAHGMIDQSWADGWWLSSFVNFLIATEAPSIGGCSRLINRLRPFLKPTSSELFLKSFSSQLSPSRHLLMDGRPLVSFWPGLFCEELAFL